MARTHNATYFINATRGLFSFVKKPAAFCNDIFLILILSIVPQKVSLPLPGRERKGNLTDYRFKGYNHDGDKIPVITASRVFSPDH
jgi:hypothetical protein